MDLHLAGLSRTIAADELGRRLRRARTAAGMSQAQVAGSDVSAAYISRIESGARRPEAHLLERMAQRMGVRLEELLTDVTPTEKSQLELAVAQVELTLLIGRDADAALEVINELLAKPAPEGDVGAQRHVQRLRAQALAANGIHSEAIAILEDLATTRDRRPTAEDLAALLILARCHLDTGNLGRAQRTGDQAAAVIESLGLESTPAAVEVARIVTESYHHQGRGETALSSLSAWQRIDSPTGNRELAMAYWAASSAAAEAGDLHSAQLLASKSRAMFEMLDAARDLVRLKITAAELHLQADPPCPEQALAILSDVGRHEAPGDIPNAELAQVHLVRGRAFLARNEAAEAREQAQLARQLAGPASTTTAAALTVEAGAQLLTGNGTSAHELLQEAVQILLDATGGIGLLWFDVAELLAEVGDSDGALHAFRSGCQAAGLQRSA